MLATLISSPNTQQYDMMQGNVRHGLYHRPWPSGVCSGMMRQFTTSWAMLSTLSLFYLALGGVICHYFISVF
jgi:hypothetical protein